MFSCYIFTLFFLVCIYVLKFLLSYLQIAKVVLNLKMILLKVLFLLQCSNFYFYCFSEFPSLCLHSTIPSSVCLSSILSLRVTDLVIQAFLTVLSDANRVVGKGPFIISWLQWKKRLLGPIHYFVKIRHNSRFKVLSIIDRKKFS